ncbi:MAG: adenine phosphoribosyltransferase [Alphaproteobacteria bacterium]|nr:adenine phosphoribosyltransferase [Alphaproteobacteria bacterium]
MNLRDCIREIPDFPKPGILFYDIAPLLQAPAAWDYALDALAEAVAPLKPDVLAGVESRGFLVAAPLALKLQTGFIMVRKKGKLPGTTVRHEYFLEYGTDIIEVQADVIEPGQRVVVLDDLLATGGTAAASITLLERVGGKVVGCAFLIELGGLNGREALGDVPVSSLLSLD